MNNLEPRQITIQPIISYPRKAEVGKTYLLTIDVQTDTGNWPYPQEDYALHCILETEPLFSHQSLGDPVVILNRFGGTYGPATFVLTASLRPQSGTIRFKLVNEQGLLLQSYNLPDVRIARVLVEAESAKSESHADGQNLRNSIVAILGTDKLIRGTGFIVSESHILTCAHVVRSIGANQESLVYVQPYNSHDLLPARAIILSDDEDVAVMELETSLPEKMRAVLCDLSKGSESHHFKSFGFVSRGMVDAVWVQGSIIGLLNQNWVLQLQAKGIVDSMSGAPILDNFSQRVVGMISYKAGRSGTPVLRQHSHAALPDTATNRPTDQPSDSPIASQWQLSKPDLDRLVNLLVPEFLTLDNRKSFCITAFAESSRKNDILSTIEFDGPARDFAIRLIHQLIQFGQIETGQEALGMFINKLLGYIGSGPDTDFLRELFHTYPALDDSLRPVVGMISNDTVFAISMERIQQVWPDLLFITLDAKLLQYCQEQVSHLTSPRYQIDSRFVQLTLLVDQGQDFQGIRFTADTQRKYDNLKMLLADIDEQFVVLLGPPGSGKTSLLRRLQYEQAQSILHTDKSDRIPFFINLNAYRAQQLSSRTRNPYDWLASQWHIAYPNMPSFDEVFNKGSFLLLLDGLNEMPHRNKAEFHNLIKQWNSFLHQNAGNTVVFSCRSLDYSASLSSETVLVRQVQIEPLSLAQIRQFLQMYLGEKAEAVWETLSRDNQQLRVLSTPFFLRLLVDQIVATGEIPRGRASLLTGFVRRALHREVAEKYQGLFNPNTLLSANDVKQVIENRWNTPYTLPEEGILILRLASLAFMMQDGLGSGTGLVSIPEPKAIELLDHERADDLIRAGIQLNVLHKDIATRAISFSHQLLQEYFAARHLNRRPNLELLAVPWRTEEVVPSLKDSLINLSPSDPLPPIPGVGWEYTALLVAAMANDQESFLADLIPVNLPLAARCAAISEVQASSQLQANLRKRLVKRISDPKADLRARIAAGEALGEIGDPRFSRHTGPHGAYLAPPLVRIKGGVYKIGDDNSTWDDERPLHSVNISSFQIGLFPVTNAEFSLFIEAGGYEHERWWQTKTAGDWWRGEWHSTGQKVYYRNMVKQLSGRTDDDIKQLPGLTPEQIYSFIWLKNVEPEELERQLDEWFPVGRVYRQPEYWNDSRFSQPAYPVVGITWFEACAYCAWLSAQDGKQYRLPTEVEWEAAAGAQDGRIYPYGNQFDVVSCNTYETHIRMTTPVGVFPSGRSRNGIEDLSGNVNEWTTSNYLPYPYQSTDGREDEPESAVRKVIRGGSWSENNIAARIKHRQNAYVDVRMNNIGFRVVSIQ